MAAELASHTRPTNLPVGDCASAAIPTDNIRRRKIGRFKEPSKHYKGTPIRTARVSEQVPRTAAFALRGTRSLTRAAVLRSCL
jgi:hypothetical protein